MISWRTVCTQSWWTKCNERKSLASEVRFTLAARQISLSSISHCDLFLPYSTAVSLPPVHSTTTMHPTLRRMAGHNNCMLLEASKDKAEIANTIFLLALAMDPALVKYNSMKSQHFTASFLFKVEQIELELTVDIECLDSHDVFVSEQKLTSIYDRYGHESFQIFQMDWSYRMAIFRLRFHNTRDGRLCGIRHRSESLSTISRTSSCFHLDQIFLSALRSSCAR